MASKAMASAPRKIKAPTPGAQINKLQIGARYKGRRQVRWEDENRNLFSFWIDANPVTADPKSVLHVRMAARESIEEGDAEWFHPDEYSTTLKKWRDLVKAVWSEIVAKRLLSAEGFADADAKRAMSAEIYRRSHEIYDMLGEIIAAHRGGTYEQLIVQIERAGELRGEIGDVGAQTFKDVSTALKRVIG